MRGFAGAEDKVIVVLADTATKLYHTSFRLATPQPMDEIVVYVAPTNVPAVLTQVVPDVRDIAPAQSSLAGPVCVTHILKLATVPEPEGFAFKLATRT